jgi:hypothetical protein
MVPNGEFSSLASDERVTATAAALEANGFRSIVTGSGDEARRVVLELLPAGAEVFNATSRTLESIGLAQEIEQSGRFNAVRSRLVQLDRATQGREMRSLGAAPDFVIGSVHAVTEQGQVLVASASGSQLAAYVYGAGSVIWVVGTQKVVRDLDEGLRRITEYSFPLEDARAQAAYGIHSAVNKLLVVHREFQPGRVTVVLVKENLGY